MQHPKASSCITHCGFGGGCVLCASCQVCEAGFLELFLLPALQTLEPGYSRVDVPLVILQFSLPARAGCRRSRWQRARATRCVQRPPRSRS